VIIEHYFILKWSSCLQFCVGDALSALMSPTRVSYISCQRHLNHNEIKDKIITTNSLDIYCLETSVVHFGGTVPTSHMPGYMQSLYFNGMD
jgi:hypothetical protein